MELWSYAAMELRVDSIPGFSPTQPIIWRSELDLYLPLYKLRSQRNVESFLLRFVALEVVAPVLGVLFHLHASTTLAWSRT